MHFKLLIALVEEDKTEAVLRAAREAGATGATVINQARGEGLLKPKTFLGLALAAPRDVVLLLVEEHMARPILETINEVGCFDCRPGAGIAFQVDVEDAVGVAHQVQELRPKVEEEL